MYKHMFYDASCLTGMSPFKFSVNLQKVSRRTVTIFKIPSRVKAVRESITFEQSTSTICGM